MRASEWKAEERGLACEGSEGSKDAPMTIHVTF